MSQSAGEIVKLLLHPLKFRLFLLSKLPSAYFAGVRIRAASEEAVSVSIPYKWFSTNPFRSTYFACLAMAAEMSTGALGMMHLHKRVPGVSMLVVKVEGDYFKKATGRTLFTCVDGLLIRQTIEDAVSSGQPRSIRARSLGKNEQGEDVAEFFITWSFKARSQTK
jgi:hypothetical protein